MLNNPNTTTDFGYQQVPVDEKAEKVADVFTSVASKYDLMNDLMSFGVHRIWKKFTLDLSNVRAGQHVLDIAGGTGDLSREFVKRVGPTGQVYLADINAAMLNVGRDRLLNQGMVETVNYIQANAETLPFAENSFDCISIAFGLRNVTHKDKALASMYQTLKPGGQLLVLEFSKPVLPLLQAIYDKYSFSVLPKLGDWVAGDAASYQYLAESIRMHPDQETLKTMMAAAGFDKIEYHNLSGGIVALHRGWKY
jgi:demethylmenaquinone methyltransferase/2-methoxy-6-polyprenyl-1,4-benzoquinol methylase